MIVKKQKKDNYYKLLGLPTFLIGIIALNVASIIYILVEYFFINNSISLNKIYYPLSIIIIFFVFGFPFMGFYKLKIFDGKINVEKKPLIKIFDIGFENLYHLENIRKVLFITYSNNITSIKLKLDDGNVVSIQYPSLSIIAAFIPLVKDFIHKFETGIANDIASFAGCELRKENYNTN